MKVNLLLLMILISLSGLKAQINGRDRELSFSGTIGAMKSSREYQSPTYSYSSEGELHYYIIADARLGFLLNPNFEIEPELQLSLFETQPIAYSLNGNLLYNFESDSSKTKPFLLLGYGIGNSVPFFRTALPQSSDPDFVHQLNAGAGMRFMLSDEVAIRMEYRFQMYKYSSESTGYYSYKSSYTYYMHYIYFGVSLLL